MRNLLLTIAIAVIAFSCKKEIGIAYNNETKANLSIEFDNIAGSSDLQLNTGHYTNSSGEKFSVTKLKYYVSNFVLTNVNDTVYTVPKDSCYFLIDESDATTLQPVLHVPEGEYKTLTFTIGIDSIKSTADVSRRTGVLDPSGAGADMYWGWNSGYIFFKMEGISSSSTSIDGSFMFHVGGFGGYSSPTINNIKTVTLNLTTRGMPQVKSGKETNIHLMVDILKVFNGTTNISIAANPMVMFSPFSTNIAGNYATMFRHDHTEN